MSVMKSKNAKWRTFLVVTALISWFAAIGAPQYSRSNKQSPSALDFMGTPPTPRPLFDSMPAQSPDMIYRGPVQSSAAKSQFNTQRFTMADGSVQTRDELMQSRAGRQYLDAHDKTTPRDFVDGIVEGPIWEIIPIIGPVGKMIVDNFEERRYRRIKRRIGKGIEVPKDDAIFVTSYEARKTAIEDASVWYCLGRIVKNGSTWLVLFLLLCPVFEFLYDVLLKDTLNKVRKKVVIIIRGKTMKRMRMPGVTLAAFMLGYIDILSRFARWAYGVDKTTLLVSLATLIIVIAANARRNWARLVWTVLIGFGIVCAFGLWAMNEYPYPALAFGSMVLSIALLVCLWHPKTNEWFGSPDEEYKEKGQTGINKSIN